MHDRERPFGPPPAAPTIAVLSLGCRANQEEVDCLLGALAEKGFRPVPFGQPADWTLVNTCSVTAAGESDARQAIRKAARVSGGRVVATGCFVQRDPEQAARIGADLVIGNGEKWRIPELLEARSAAEAAGAAADSAASSSTVLPEILWTERPTTRRFLRHAAGAFGDRTRAALKIQDGCNERCTYCIIPKLRGESVSRDPEEILEEARRLVLAGYPEITLTGIHSASYGADLTGELRGAGRGAESPSRLSRLLRRLLEVDGLARIRVNSLEPQWVDEELLETLASSPRFCRHLHLPLQSGDAKVLRRMGRGYTPEEYAGVVERARARIPGVAIGADVIAGFPGEDESAFGNTVSLLERIRPAYLHVFPYSARPGVASLRLPGEVSEPEKKRRARALRDLDLDLRARFLRQNDRESAEVVIESSGEAGGAAAQGWTDTYIRVDAEGSHPEGARVRVRLRWTGDPRRMRGELLPAPGHRCRETGGEREGKDGGDHRG